MAQQLAQSRRSRSETRYLLSNPANAARLRESIRELNQGRGIPVAFGPDGNLVRSDS